MRTLLAEVILRIHEPRQGLCFARNRAVAEASGELILWTDDDVLVDAAWLSEHVDAAFEWPEAAFFGGTIEPHFEGKPPGWVTRNLGHLRGPYSLVSLDDSVKAMRANDFPIGANMAVRTEILRKYPFDTAIGRSGNSMVTGDDTQLFQRLIADGFHGVWVGPARVKHCIIRDRQKINYIWSWYGGNGRTAARIFGPGKSPREAVGLLARSKIDETGQSRGAGAGASWWSVFFSGPFWLRAIKAAAYFGGFQRELSRIHNAGQGSSTHKAIPASDQAVSDSAAVLGVAASLDGTTMRSSRSDWGQVARSWLQIPGFFDFKAVYDAAVETAADGAVFVEVGSLVGRSACYLATKIRESGKAITLYAIDTGLGSPSDLTGQDIAPSLGGSFAGTLCKNIIGCGLGEIVVPIITTSARAAHLFRLESIDFCFIDGDHSYSSVTVDLQTWWPKVKLGGTIAGHDYRHSAPWLVGVTPAVHEFFGVQDVAHPLCPSCWLVAKPPKE